MFKQIMSLSTFKLVKFLTPTLLISIFILQLCTFSLLSKNFIHFNLNTNEGQCSYPKADHSSKDVNIFSPSLQLAQDSPEILNYLREFHLSPPSTEKYEFDKPDRKIGPDYFAYKKTDRNFGSQYLEFLEKLFKNKKNGFFIEAGANDGEFFSNTLHLEMVENWTGLLIEPNQFMLTKLRVKGRKAWVADVCLALEKTPHRVRFMHVYNRKGQRNWENGIGKIEPTRKKGENQDLGNYIFAGMAECFPLYSILSAINQTTVDYLSLDVEGVELKILKTIPFDLLKIKVISAEIILIPEGKAELEKFLISKNFQPVYKTNEELFVINKEYLSEFNLK